MRKVTATAALLATVIANGCSDASLSRREAREVLQAVASNPITAPDKLVFAWIGDFPESTHADKGCQDPQWWPPEVGEREQQLLRAAGIIQIDQRGCDWRISLTALGARFVGAAMQPGGLQEIRVATFAGWDVTSLQQSGEDAQLSVALYFSLNQAGAALQRAGYREDQSIGDDPKLIIVNGKQRLTRVEGAWHLAPAAPAS